MKNEKEMHVDGGKSLRLALEKYFDLKDYKYIMHYIKTDQKLNDDKFTGPFNRFYKIRRKPNWQDAYYRIFEEERKKERKHKGSVNFEEIIRRIYDEAPNGEKRVEASFASKMLASLNSDKPILDSNVMKFFKLEISDDKDVETRLKSAVDTYNEIEKRYDEYFKNHKSEVENNVNLFNKIFGEEYVNMNKTKIIDYMIWSLCV